MIENTSARHMWGDFLDANLEHAFREVPKIIWLSDNPEDSARKLDQIVNGRKRAISKSLLGVQLRGESLPKIGDFLVVLGHDGLAKCILKITSVRLRPLFSIPEDYMRTDGYENTEQWKRDHWTQFKAELEPFGRVPRDSMIVVCQTFEKVY